MATKAERSGDPVLIRIYQLRPQGGFGRNYFRARKEIYSIGRLMPFYYRLNQLRVPLKYTERDILSRAARLCKIPPKGLKDVTIIGRSVDARKEPQYVLSLRVETKEKLKRLPSGVEISDPPSPTPTIPKLQPLSKSPIVVGAGPAGLAAAWYLAKVGLKPILIERGEAAKERHLKVMEYWNRGVLDTESNVHFGEGGAGLFSDGKLTARSKERGLVYEFLSILQKSGASPDILIDKLPHIGSDELLKIVPNLRNDIIQSGGEVLFSTCLKRVNLLDGRVKSIDTNRGSFETDHLILASGHSAGDIYKMLDEIGAKLTLKPFAIGLRLELPQSTINHCRYKNYTEELGQAEFRLARKPTESSRSCYSFCMCPGGQVISCSNEVGRVTSNGMSYSKRSLPSGNAAFLVPVTPSDVEAYLPGSPLAGVEFQKHWEERAFIAGGGDYALPASTLSDFLLGRAPDSINIYTSPHKIKPANLHDILPDFVRETLLEAIPKMLREVGSPKPEEVMLYGPEMRSSAPLQISRDDGGESVNIRGLYPAGEGAGYSGGIVSSGVDGLKAAKAVVNSVIDKKSRSNEIC